MKIHIIKFTTKVRAAFAFAMFVFFCSFLTAIPGTAQEIIKASIKSEVLGQDRIFGIHLPKNYDAKAKKKYPVIYVLDGFKQIFAKTDALSGQGLVPETIVVGIADMGDENRQVDLLPPYPQ